jgi:hypothetical protein
METPPNYALRLNDTDKQNLKALADLLRLKRSDTIRYIVAKELRAMTAAQPPEQKTSQALQPATL